MTAHWSLGVLIGLPVVGLLVLACVLFIAFAIWLEVSEGDGVMLVFGGLGALLAVLLTAGAIFWPWSAQYHRWQPKTGTVTDVSSRFLGDGDGGTNQKFVVQFNNDPNQRYGCNDTRCSLIKEGDTLTLSCKRTWQYAGEDGWDCNYVRDEAAA